MIKTIDDILEAALKSYGEIGGTNIMRKKRMTGRKCYDHLGGNLGAALFDFYVSNGWIELEDGKNTIFKITEKGHLEFAKMGLYIETDML